MLMLLVNLNKLSAKCYTMCSVVVLLLASNVLLGNWVDNMTVFEVNETIELVWLLFSDNSISPVVFAFGLSQVGSFNSFLSGCERSWGWVNLIIHSFDLNKGIWVLIHVGIIILLFGFNLSELIIKFGLGFEISSVHWVIWSSFWGME